MPSNNNDVPDGYTVIFCKRFWHAKAHRYITAAPGKTFRLIVKIRPKPKKPPPRKKAA